MEKTYIVPVTYENERMSCKLISMQIFIFRMLRNNTDACQCSYFELGRPVVRSEERTTERSYNSETS